MSELESNEVEAPTLAILEMGLSKFADVLTSDDIRVGRAIRIHERKHDINPGLKLYAAYLESNSIKMGGPIFIPTDFIEEFLAETNQVILSVELSYVQRETWDRTPGFIAHRNSIIHELA